ncbi:MAG TPA: SH3 domain-containing protein, partial [Terriglobales bacterium]|nr:SH3 domain-containing protein [Terriglobales bacterium]
MSSHRLQFGKFQPLTAICILAIAAAVWASSEHTTAERTYHASKAEVEKALRDLQAYSGGKLPILDGFVAPGERPLGRYQRGYYQYSFDILSVSPSQTRVRVAAKITAWYTDDSSSQSGYEVLTSNGRLESDLFDRLGEVLREPAAAVSAQYPSAVRESSAPARSVPDAPLPTGKPSLAASAGIPLPLPHASSSGSSSDAARDKLIRELKEKIKALEDVLHNQGRPTDLAAVKNSHTPVTASPSDGGKILFLADAEDEFQVIDTNESWVHVQISGISRGWIRRSQVDLPGAMLGDPAQTPANAERADKDAFRKTREETSLFPGKWEPLAGKKVRMIWVQPSESKTFGERNKLGFAKSVFRKAYPELSQATPDVAGVVIVFDSEDGGMAAVTAATLQQWQAGHL